MSVHINLKQLKKIAELAKLSFSDDELDAFADEFSNILEYIQQINECDTLDIQDLHHQFDYKAYVLQHDTVCVDDILKQEDFFVNATERNEGGYITTSQIVSKN